MNQQDTYSSLLGTYQQAKARGENVLLTLETKDCVETVQLTVSRPAGGPAAWREERGRVDWRTQASPPTDWRTPAGQGPGAWRRSPGTGASGGAPPTPPSSRKKSQSQRRRDMIRSEVRKSAWSKKELDFEQSELNVKKSEALEETKAVKKPRLVEEPKPVEKKEDIEDHKLDFESESVSEEKKPYPKMSLEWTNIICDELTDDGKTKPYHILVKPNKILCGGIAVKDNHQTFTGLHRKECWNNESPCCEWPDSHDTSNLIEYSREHKILQVRLDSFVWSRKGDTLTFDWSLFNSEAAEYCFERGLKKLLKIFEP